MKEQILVVEDCAGVRQLLHDALAYAGYRVTEARDGRAALRHIAADTPDLVLLDIGLPDLSGWDILWLLRLSERWRHVPVVVLTGQADAASQTYGWQLGCTCYLAKPFDVDDLQLVVRKVLAATKPALSEPHNGAMMPALRAPDTVTT